jgi:prepilin-type N-terminal cleavage/methylation domain-containing protein
MDLSSRRYNAITLKRNNGFTFIELLITLAVIAICFLPLMRMFSVSLEQVYVIEDLTTARYLAQEGMEKVKNLGFTEAQLEDLSDIWEPPLDKPPLELNGKYWRVFRKIIKGTDPLEVKIQVHQVAGSRHQVSEKPIVEVVTLVEDLDWTPIE